MSTHLDPETLSELLESLSDPEEAKRTMRRIQPLRGVRGVSLAEVNQIAIATWEETPPTLGVDDEGLSELFSAAWEDGLVAIGLLAAAGLSDPEGALDLAEEWATRTDDVETADVLGALVVGPACIALGKPLTSLACLHNSRAAARRIAVVAGLAYTPWTLSGPGTGPLRTKLGEKDLRFVETPDHRAIAAILGSVIRDEAPQLRKAVRRLLTEWHRYAPEEATEWVLRFPGGVPKMISEVVLPKPKRKPRRRR
ncbi:MAG: DNA alkylation repair protein [Deltaproteobacteria bacterium]|nr:DNA alkylation repair protein [Deltaproteobacteria bacterium]